MNRSRTNRSASPILPRSGVVEIQGAVDSAYDDVFAFTKILRIQNDAVVQLQAVLFDQVFFDDDFIVFFRKNAVDQFQTIDLRRQGTDVDDILIFADGKEQIPRADTFRFLDSFDGF